MGKDYDAADYEGREETAITDGKRALAGAPWLSNRTNTLLKGFFCELKVNDHVHPAHYAVHCVDGVGTKLFLSAWSGDFRSFAQDAVAMNANDMATILRAFPDCIDLYFAVQGGVEEQHMGEILGGFVDALEKIRSPHAPFNVNVGKIETASLDEMISLGVRGKGWDVGVAMTGFIRKVDVPKLDPKPGYYIVGVSSTGAHSNGFTGARHVLFPPDVEYRDEWKPQYKGKFSFDDRPAVLEGKTVLEALKVPTALYMVEASLIGKEFDDRDIFGVNITGNGLHNFNRAGRDVSFEITDPLPILPIHKLLVQESGWSPRQAYTKQNMGMGFAYVVPTLDVAERVVDLVNKRGENTAQIVGIVRASRHAELRTILRKPYEGPAIDFVGYTM